MATTIVDDDLWERFHTAVNMSSRELRDWLATQGAGEETEELPDQAGRPLGRRVLEVLGKRRSDLTTDDVAVMERVVQEVTTMRGDEPESMAGDTDWRHGLMNVGHDPLKAT